MQFPAFAEALEEMLELDRHSIRRETELADLVQWDSLAFVTFLAMADARFGAQVAPSALRDCRTVLDLWTLVQR